MGFICEGNMSECPHETAIVQMHVNYKLYHIRV